MPYQRFQSADSKPRYSKGQISVFGINSIHPRTPWIAAWWSAASIWELVVNNQAHINMAIALSFLGRFDEAKAQINQSWGLLYVAVFVYSIWDSYRCAVEINKNHSLAEIEDAPITPSAVYFFRRDDSREEASMGRIGLVRLITWIGPTIWRQYGSGHIHFAWWIYVCYKSEAIRAWLHSFLGDFSSVTEMVDWQWFLFLPSMYAFAIYQAYTSVNESYTILNKSDFSERGLKSWHTYTKQKTIPLNK